jgi:FkbM family methyltransferase
MEGARDFYEVAPSCQIPNLGFLYELVFGQRTAGTFVEVGAYDGITFSNSSALANAGWKGFCIEPVESFADLCRAQHAGNDCITVDTVAIGARAGELTIHVGGSLSTASDELLREYRETPWSSDEFIDSQTVRAPMTTLDMYLERRRVPIGFEVLIVDVEGYEADVFAGFALEKWQPTMLIVELTDAHPQRVAHREADAILGRQIVAGGYSVLYKDSSNTVFVRER